MNDIGDKCAYKILVYLNQFIELNSNDRRLKQL